MTRKPTKLLAYMLVAVGATIIVFSPRIVFPGLEMIVGIETIVGKNSVSYNPDGSYMFTNPGAMIRWIASVAGIGLLTVVAGVALILRARTANINCQPSALAHAGTPSVKP